MRAEEVRLVELETNAAIERRVAHVRAGRSRAAEEIQMVILGVDAPFLLRPVPDAEVHAVVAPFRDGDARRDVLRLQLGIHRLDVRELKQLETVQTPLRLLHETAPVQIPGLERELALDDAIA